jgi:coenzyme Q-binding protein COQ10
MGHYQETRLLPYTVEQLFDLVADFERYPEFLPWWVAARVRHRSGATLHVDQLIKVGIVRWRFASKTVLTWPERIDVDSTHWPFRRLHIRWSFQPTPDGRCRLTLTASYEFRSPMTQRLATAMFDQAIRRIAGAFEGRARAVYAPRPNPYSRNARTNRSPRRRGGSVDMDQCTAGARDLGS